MQSFFTGLTNYIPAERKNNLLDEIIRDPVVVLERDPIVHIEPLRAGLDADRLRGRLHLRVSSSLPPSLFRSLLNQRRIALEL